MKLTMKEIFECGYCDCGVCVHKQTDGVWGDEDWFCGFKNVEYAVNLDDLEECPLGENMPHTFKEE